MFWYSLRVKFNSSRLLPGIFSLCAIYDAQIHMHPHCDHVTFPQCQKITSHAATGMRGPTTGRRQKNIPQQIGIIQLTVWIEASSKGDLVSSLSKSLWGFNLSSHYTFKTHTLSHKFSPRSWCFHWVLLILQRISGPEVCNKTAICNCGIGVAIIERL